MLLFPSTTSGKYDVADDIVIQLSLTERAMYMIMNANDLSSNIKTTLL